MGLSREAAFGALEDCLADAGIEWRRLRVSYIPDVVASRLDDAIAVVAPQIDRTEAEWQVGGVSDHLWGYRTLAPDELQATLRSAGLWILRTLRRGERIPDATLLWTMFAPALAPPSPWSGAGGSSTGDVYVQSHYRRTPRR